MDESKTTALFRLCATHLVATCPACRVSYRPDQLMRDHLAPTRPFVCPACRFDLRRSLEVHIRACDNFVGNPLSRIAQPSAGSLA